MSLPAEVTTTYLEMTVPPAEPLSPPPAGTEVRRSEQPSPRFYRYLYAGVGASWHWRDRSGLGDEDLLALIGQAEVYVLYHRGTPAGYAELDFRRASQAKLQYFGLFPEHIGQGLGGWFLGWVVREAWRPGIARVWVHTCTLDHPNALPTYQKAGFRVYDQVVTPNPYRGKGFLPSDQEQHGAMAETETPQVLDTSELTYQEYLRIPELLSLQTRRSDPPAHDELLFIIIHQAFELWFKQLLHEMESALRAMDKGRMLRAHHFMSRVVKIMRLLVQQIAIIETMATAEFLLFRDRLNPASGFQSIQFREIEFLAGVKEAHYLEVFKNRPEFREVLARRIEQRDLSEAFRDLVMREAAREGEGLQEALVRLYEDPDANLRLYLLAESLVDFDEAMAQWRHTHVLMVERVIGFRRGTGGSAGVRYLETTLSKRCFPYLWEVRTHLQKRGT